MTLLVQQAYKNANLHQISGLPKSQPVMSILDPFQLTFDIIQVLLALYYESLAFYLQKPSFVGPSSVLQAIFFRQNTFLFFNISFLGPTSVPQALFFQPKQTCQVLPACRRRFFFSQKHALLYPYRIYREFDIDRWGLCLTQWAHGRLKITQNNSK